MKPKPPKKVWKIRVKESTNGSPDALFYMVDENDNITYPTTSEQSRHKMFEYAIEHGADEVKHDYDNVKYGS